MATQQQNRHGYRVVKDCKLNLMPEALTQRTENQASLTFTAGDLHGNTMKLVYYLVLFGVIYMEKHVYSSLFKLYKEHKSKAFTELFTIQVKISKNYLGKIIFLGDTICDRGICDYMTFFVFHWLDQKKVNFIILFSNHDYGFLRYYLGGNDEQVFSDKVRAHLSKEDQSRSYCSCITKQKSIFSNWRSKLKQYMASYFKHLQLFDIDEDNHIFYSHAPITFHMSYGLNMLFRYCLDDITSTKSFSFDRESVQRINEKFIGLFKEHVHPERRGFFGPIQFDFSKNEGVLWNRQLQGKHVLLNAGYTNVFGHVSKHFKKDCFVSLDSKFGFPEQDNGDIAFYWSIQNRANLITVRPTSHLVKIKNSGNCCIIS